MHEAIPREGDELKESRALFPRIQKAFRKCDAGTAVQDVPAAGSTRDLVLKGLPEVYWIDYCEITLSCGDNKPQILCEQMDRLPRGPKAVSPEEELDIVFDRRGEHVRLYDGVLRALADIVPAGGRCHGALLAVASCCEDADLTVEALSNLPEDARGRLQTLLTLSQEVADQAAHGHLVVVDTGLGQATYTLLESGEESATTEDADAEQPARQPVLAWADQLDPLDDFAPTVLQPPPALAPVLQQPQPQQTQVQPTQVPQPATDTQADRPHRRQRGQPGTRDVRPVTGERRQPGPSQQPQPITQPPIADPRCLSAFPNELEGFNSGIFFARLTAVGDRGFLPPTVPYSRAFPPLSAARDPRLPQTARAPAGGLLPLPLPSLPHAGMLQVIDFDQTRRRLAYSSRVSQVPRAGP
eukprot:s3435_g7.t1